MDQKYLIVIVLLAVTSCVTSGNEDTDEADEDDEVPFIQKCRAEDSKCIKENAERAIPIFAQGMPNLGVDSLDPLIIDRVDASSPNLKLIVTDIKAKGLKDCVVKKIKRDNVKSKIYVKAECSLEITGHYDMTGKILILPIEGHGKAKVILRRAVFAVDSTLDRIKKSDGKFHWHIKDWKHTFELKEKSTLIFENLFDGNQILARAANELIDSSPNEIILEIGNPMIEAVMKKVILTIDQFYKAVPEEDLALD